MAEGDETGFQGPTPRIGELLVAAGKMTPAQADVAATLGIERNLLFGQAAVILGFVSPRDVTNVLEQIGSSHQPMDSGEISADISVLRDLPSPQGSDFRRLAQSLALRWFRSESRHPALSIISADRAEGRTTTATNLACSFARAGIRTLLIDADLHNPTIHKKFGLEPSPSSSSYYSVKGLDKLTLLPATAAFDADYDKFMRSALTAIVEAKSAEFDVIFVDTPAASVSSDYLLAGLATKGAIVVTREGFTKARSAAKMLNSCEDVGIPVVGGIMLKA